MPLSMHNARASIPLLLNQRIYIILQIEYYKINGTKKDQIYSTTF